MLRNEVIGPKVVLIGVEKADKTQVIESFYNQFSEDNKVINIVA